MQGGEYMGTIRSSIELYNGWTPALQSISNAINMTISHFEKMQRVSGDSINVGALSAARNEIRNAEATIAQMQQRLTGVDRTGQRVSEGLHNIGNAASVSEQHIKNMTQAVQKQTNELINMANMTGQSALQVTQALQGQTSAMVNMASITGQSVQQVVQLVQGQTNEMKSMANVTAQSAQAIQKQTNELINMSNATERATKATERQTGATIRMSHITEQSMLQMTKAMQHQTVESIRMGNVTEQSLLRIVGAIQKQTNEIVKLTETVENAAKKIPPPIDGSRRAQNGFNRSLNNGAHSANRLFSIIKNIAGVYLSLRGINIIGKLSDSMASITARLNLINDGLRTTKELSDTILKSSFESGASYTDTASSIAKMGLNAGAAFNSNDELIAFMDQVNKTFVIGGASAMEQSSAMLQLTQAMAAGALRGQELNSILAGAPGIARNIEKYMGWAAGSIKKYAEEGKVTAQVVKNAMLSFAEETNEKFNSMPATISQTFTRIKTLAIKSFTPVLQGINRLFNHDNAKQMLYQWGAVFQYIADRANRTIEKLNNIVNSDEFIAFSQDVMTAFAVAGAVATFFFDTLVNGFEYVINNWDTFQPMLVGVAVAMGLVTAAQIAMNIAMYANPITLIIVGITLLIVLLYKMVDKINEVKDTTISATGIIAGVIGGFYAIVYNVFAAAWNVVAAFVNFFGNVFKDPVASIKILFLELGNVILSLIQTVVQSLSELFSHIPGMSFVVEGLDKFDNWLSRTQNKANTLIDKIKNDMDYEEFLPSMEYKNVHETVAYFYDKAAGFSEGIKQYMEDFNPFEGVQGVNELLADILKNVQSSAEDTSKIADGLERDKEDLEFLRTVANIKYGDKYVMPQVKVEMTNNNNIQSDMDLDGFFDRKVEEMAQIITASAEGVHI